MKRINCFIQNEEGVTAIEYSLMGALIALAIIVGVTALGSSLGELYNQIAECVTTVGKTCQL